MSGKTLAGDRVRGAAAGVRFAARGCWRLKSPSAVVDSKAALFPRARIALLLLSASFALAGCRNQEAAKAKPGGNAGPATAAGASAALQPPVPVALGAPAVGDEQPPIGRLPADVTPLAYTLGLTLLPEAPGFFGSVRIDLEFTRERRMLWLHGRGLDVSEVMLEVGAQRLAGRYEPVHADGVARIAFASAVPKGRAVLSMRFSAPWSTERRGLYRTTENQQAYVLGELSPGAARSVFPGFDEPGFKTPFEVTLTVPASSVAQFTSAAVSERSAAAGQREVHFAPTAKLPAHLLSFAVGPLEVVQAPAVAPDEVRQQPLALRGLAFRGKGGQLSFALARTAELVSALERYFGVPYPFDKLDLLAAPSASDDALGNAASLVLPEELLLLDEKTATAEQRRTCTEALARGLAQQWVGGLVTARWWDDAWLNQALASHLGSASAEQSWPQEGFVLAAVRRGVRALDADGLATARPLRQPVASVRELGTALAAPSVAKGAAILGTFERWLGREPFRKGIALYLQRFRFGSATVDDFLASLAEGSGTDVRPALRTFLEQAGAPLLEVTPLCKPGGTEPARIRVRQSRTLSVGAKAPPTGLWQVPVCLRFAVRGDGAPSERQHCAMLSRAEEELPLPGTNGCPEWLHPNAGGAGYYRWTLPVAFQARLRAAASSLSASERIRVDE